MTSVRFIHGVGPVTLLSTVRIWDLEAPCVTTFVQSPGFTGGVPERSCDLPHIGGAVVELGLEPGIPPLPCSSHT